MHRKALQKLIDWKLKQNRKPLVIRGARQVGKTWLAQEFGRRQYESVAYVNLDGNTQMKNLFELDYDIDRIVEGLEVATNVAINPGTTLIILDEIQEVPRALAALKYFYENRPEYHVVVAGSLLGVALHQGTSFPVGKVEFIDLYPLDFVEFLQATGNNQYAAMLMSETKDFQLIGSFHDKLMDLLKMYYVTGGLPEVVSTYAEDGGLLRVREVQRNILAAYEQDLSKHAPVNVVAKLREIWDILPAQLAKENKKFIFRLLRSGARAKEYEMALLWLEDAGLAHRVTRVNRVALPLRAYADNNIFKLFMLDVGLLGAKSGLNPNIILDSSDIFIEFKGALTEQFVFQEMQAAGKEMFYFANEESRGEIDFIVSIGDEIVPIEVKSGFSTRARSLDAFVAENKTKHALLLSAQTRTSDGPITRAPLYLASAIDDLLL